MRILRFFSLFKLNRCRRFPRTIVHYAVYAFDFIDDTVGDFGEDFPGDLGGIGGHEVGGVYGTEGDGVIVGTEITHNTYGTHVGQGCEILTKTFIDSCFCDLFTVDGVGFLNDFYFFLGYFSDDTDSKAGTREGLTVHQILGDTKLQTGAPNLIFKKKT